MAARAAKDVESLAAVMNARFAQVDAQFADVRQELRDIRADNKDMRVTLDKVRDEVRDIGSRQKALLWVVILVGTLATLAVTFGKLLERLWATA